MRYESSYLTRLAELSVKGNPISPAGIARLKERFGERVVRA